MIDSIFKWALIIQISFAWKWSMKKGINRNLPVCQTWHLFKSALSFFYFLYRTIYAWRQTNNSVRLCKSCNYCCAKKLTFQFFETTMIYELSNNYVSMNLSIILMNPTTPHWTATGTLVTTLCWWYFGNILV